MRSVFQARVYRGLFTLALGATALLSLQACVPLMVGGTVAGAIVATDRRTLGAQTDDAAIELKATGRATKITGDKGRVAVSSYNRMVLLSGEVSSAAERELAEKLAKSQENVRSVVNDLAIEPASSLTQRSKDAIATGQIKALLVDAKDLQSNAFKVVTERGIVYLMGRVTARESQRATEIARTASFGGVVKVVRVFETITEEELKRISAQPLSPQSQPKP